MVRNEMQHDTDGFIIGIPGADNALAALASLALRTRNRDFAPDYVTGRPDDKTVHRLVVMSFATTHASPLFIAMSLRIDITDGEKVSAWISRQDSRRRL